MTTERPTDPDDHDKRPDLLDTVPPELLQTIPAAEPAEVSMATFVPAGSPALEETAADGTQEHVKPPQGFDILEEIGRGGMGVVYRASQRPLIREVALKTLKSSDDATAHVEFLSEALISGCLDHPNIVPIYDLDENEDGSVVLAMKLIDGITWAHLLHPNRDHRERAATYDTEAHLEILLNVCNAVAFAHDRCIVHRDLKPENVMIGEFGEVFLTDWGVAVSFAENPAGIHQTRHRSRANSPAGTPAYMAPEMAEGDGEKLGPWTDTYLLGAILFEVVTGSTPHRGTTLEALLEAAKISAVTFPDDCHVPQSLQDICRKAMARDPADRYQTVESFSQEIRDYLGHRQSMTIAEHAGEQLEQTEQELRDAVDRSALDTDTYYRRFAEVIAAFDQALLLWDQNPDAAAGRDHARMEYARLAFEQGDYRLAKAQLRDFDDPAALDLQTRISQAMKEQARSSALNQKLRRALLAAGILVSALVLSVGFALYSTREMGLSISAMVRDLLVSHAVESLRTDHASVSAEITQLNVEKAELALLAYAGALEAAFESDPPSLEEPVYTMESVDTGVHAPPGLKHLPLYEYEGADGARVNNPVTFEAQTFFRALDLSEEAARDQIARVQQILPSLLEVSAPRTSHVIRYFCGFETGLYVAYPGHGNMPAKFDNRVRPWYQEGRTAPGILQTRPYVDVSSQHVVLSFLRPIRDPDDQSVLGVAGVDVDVAELFHMSKLPTHWVDLARVEVATPRTAEDGRRWLELKGKERSGSAAGDPTEVNLTSWDVDTTVIEDSGKPAFDQIFSGMLQGQTGVVSIDDDGEPALCAFAPLGIDQSSLLLIVPEHTVTADADRMESEIRTLAARHILQLVGTVGTLLIVGAGGVLFGIRRQNAAPSR